jgi:hypothetical protein
MTTTARPSVSSSSSASASPTQLFAKKQAYDLGSNPRLAAVIGM